jgi:hypothetical protein
MEFEDLSGLVPNGHPEATPLRVGLLVYHDGYDRLALIKELRRNFIIVENLDGAEEAYDLDQIHLPRKGGPVDQLLAGWPVEAPAGIAPEAPKPDSDDDEEDEEEDQGTAVQVTRVRPGTIVYNTDNGYGLAVVVKMLPDERVLLFCADGSFISLPIDQMGETPDGGTVMDAMADILAWSFGQFEETREFAPKVRKEQSQPAGGAV